MSLPGPVGYYLRGATEAHLSAYAAAKLPIAGIGFDHRVQISQQFSRLKSGFIQGNFDEALMFLKGNELDRELDRFFTPLLELSPSERAGWICGLGHGVLPGTPEESVRRFVNKARTLFAASGD